ncbi:SH3 domain-containing protein [Limnoraphis robusta BA-68 BA1]|nr:SH3 domain-containing protein [Limnoraphis robusta BA-68 BA1]
MKTESVQLISPGTVTMKFAITSILKPLTFAAIASTFLVTPALAETFTAGHFTVAVNASTPVCSFIVTNQVNSKVNIRKNPDLKSPVVKQLKRGDVVRAVSRQGNWVKIVALVNGFPPNEKLTPFSGWVDNRYINGCSEDQFDMWRR